MMQKLIITFIVSSIGFSLAVAQDFRQGFIVKINGDSVSGFVDNGSDKNNSRFCVFKPAKRSKKVKFLPNQLVRYGFIDDKLYESKEIITREKGGSRKSLIFMEVLVKGQVSLYLLEGEFYLKKDSLFLLPKAVKEEVKINDRTYLKISTKYVSILNIAFADCNLTANQTKYEERSLTYLVQNYNRCKGVTATVFKTQMPWAQLNASIFTGVDRSDIRLDGFSDYAVKNSISMPIGAGLEFSSPRISDKSYLNLELWYVKKFFQGYSESYSLSNTVRNDLFFEASLLKIPVGIRYNFLQESHTPYIKCGLVQYITLSVSARVISESENNGVVTTDRYDVPINNRNPYGIWVGVGYTKKIASKVSGFIDVRYEKNKGLGDSSVNSSSSGSTVNLLFGLKF